jgi:hypothetical protein
MRGYYSDPLNATLAAAAPRLFVISPRIKRRQPRADGNRRHAAANFFVQLMKDLVLWTAAGTGTFSKTRQQFYVFGQMGMPHRLNCFL